MIIAIIPARGGSKRIKNKNIKNFLSKPILYWTLKTLKKSNLFYKIIISTDNFKIKKIALKLGVDEVINRPKDLSDDITPTKPVIEHAIENTKFKGNRKVKFVCCVYPCNPFLNSSDLIKSFKILKKNLVILFFLLQNIHIQFKEPLSLKKTKNLFFLIKEMSLLELKI